MDGDSINVVSMVDFGWREWTKGHLVCVQLPHHLQTKQSSPHRDSVQVELIPQRFIEYQDFNGNITLS